MRQLIVSAVAERELSAALAWTQEHYPANVLKFRDEVRDALVTLREAPLRWSQWRQTGYRRCLLPRLPYSFFYSVDERIVHIVAFVHHHQDASRRFP